MTIATLMVGNGTGTFLIGLLRNRLALEQLYRFSSLYPLLVLILTIAVLRRPACTESRISDGVRPSALG